MFLEMHEDIDAANDVADFVLQSLRADDFHNGAHRRIFQAARKCRQERRQPVNIPLMANTLGDSLETVGGAAYLNALQNETPSQALPMVRQYVQTIREKSAFRGLMEIGADTYKQAKAEKSDPGRLADTLQQKARKIRNRAKADVTAPDLVGYDEIGENVSDTKWLWKNWLPLGHLSMLMGPVGAGKTWAALALGACVTDCRPWPDTSSGPVEGRSVIWLDYESGQAALVDRMEQAQITSERFKGISPDDMASEPYLNDPEAPDILRHWIGQHNAPLLIIDSLRHAFAGTDENDSRIASYMTPLAQVAADTNTAILIIHHTTKRQDRTLDKETWMVDTESARGSSAIAALTRSVIGVEKPDAGTDTLRLRVTKSNYASKPDPVGFIIMDHDDDSTSLQWCEAPYRPVELRPREQAAEFLRVKLQDGPQPSADLREKASEQEIARNTLYRAAKDIQVVKKDGLWGLRSYRKET